MHLLTSLTLVTICCVIAASLAAVSLPLMSVSAYDSEPTTYEPPTKPTSKSTEVVVAIPYTTIYHDIPELYTDEGWTVNGRNGQKKCVYTINYTADNRAVVSLTREEVISEPVAQVIFRGTKRHISTGEYIYPSSGRFTSGFGYRHEPGASGNHEGWDIANPRGSEVWAADGGIVIFAGSDAEHTGYGNLVIIEHENGDTTWYAHLSKITTELSATVAQGEEIGKSGSTGQTTGNCVHFEYHPNGGVPVDPAKILRKPAYDEEI